MGIRAVLFFSFLLSNPSIDYYSLSTKDFFSLPEAEQIIPSTEIDEELLCAAIFHASNEVRTSKGKSLFRMDSALLKAADFHAKYLAGISRLEHVNRKEREMIHPQNRIEKFGGTEFEVSAENLARYSTLDFGRDKSYFVTNGVPSYKDGRPIKNMSYSKMAKLIVAGWLSSRGHKLNLLGDYEYMSCGISSILLAKDSVPEIIVVQNFASK